LPTYAWLAEPELALATLAVIGVWQLFGFNMVLFLAGLVSIPKYLYEAAEMDGARSAWSRFRLVTWPMLGPVTMFVVLISAIRSFQVFDTVHVLTKGGPSKASEVLLYSMYTEGFEFFRSGLAAAIAVVFLAFVLVLTLIKSWLIERKVHF
jgi:multiple sugar transport system permease protein